MGRSEAALCMQFSKEGHLLKVNIVDTRVFEEIGVGVFKNGDQLVLRISVGNKTAICVDQKHLYSVMTKTRLSTP